MLVDWKGARFAVHRRFTMNLQATIRQANDIAHLVRGSSSGWIGRSLGVLSVTLPLFALACTTSPAVRIEEPVGPAPLAHYFLHQGRLVVHTDIIHSDGAAYSASAGQPVREPYTIFEPDGRT